VGVFRVFRRGTDRNRVATVIRSNLSILVNKNRNIYPHDHDSGGRSI
jgi:hypothetical protein